MLTLWPTFNFNKVWIKFFIDYLYMVRFDPSSAVKLTLKKNFQSSK